MLTCNGLFDNYAHLFKKDSKGLNKSSMNLDKIVPHKKWTIALFIVCKPTGKWENFCLMRKNDADTRILHLFRSNEARDFVLFY